MSEDEAAAASSAFDESEDALFEEEDTRRKRSQNPFEKSLTDKILTKTLYGTFKLAGLLLRSNAQFDTREFEEPARDLKDMVNRFKALRLVFNVLHPVVSCAGLVDKVQKLRDGMPAQQGAQPERRGFWRKKQAAEQQPEVLGPMFGPRNGAGDPTS